MGESGFWRRWLERVTGRLEMPLEAFLDLPRTILTGRQILQIENHKGILEYTPHKIRVRTTQGELVVTGTRLRIEVIFQQEAVIDGRISTVQFPT